MKEDTVQVAARKGWKTFEAFAREILRRHYASIFLEIKETPWSHDEGRDGEAVYVFAPAHTDGIVDDLTIIVKLWVEIKLRTGRPVSLKDTGNHVIRADNQKVNKLVFVTNGTFAPETREQTEIFCMNRNLSCAFVDGLRLEEMRLRTSDQPPAEKAIEIADSLGGSIEVLVRLSGEPFPRDLLPRAHVCSKPEAPVFLILDVIARGSHPRLKQPTITPAKQVEECTGYWSSFSMPIIDNERFRIVYAVWGRPGAILRPSDFKIVFGGVDDRSVSLKYDTGQATIGTRFLNPYTLPSQDRVAAPLQRALEDWLSSAGYAAYAIEAPAGVGKSYVVQQMRRTWLAKRVREIWLDGGCHSDAWSIVEALAAALFPLATLAASNHGQSILERWLKDAGVTDPEIAKDVALQLTRLASKAPPKWGTCVDILSGFLRHASAQSPVVLVYEDLHKASPSAVLLLRALLGRLNYEGAGASFVLLTTRPAEQVWRDSQSAGITSEVDQAAFGTPVEQLLAMLSQEGKLLAMNRPRTDQARSLLTCSLPHVERRLLDSIIEQVGTTPFALKEVMALLATSGAIEPGDHGGWDLGSAKVLGQRFELDDVRNATADRLTLLIRNWHSVCPWLDDFLLAGALLGRDFATVQATTAVDAPDQNVPLNILDSLFLADVLQPNQYVTGNEQLRFTHDLIRVAILKRRSLVSAQQTAARLLQAAPATMSRLLRCRLARNAGDIDGCRELAEVGYENARKKAQPWDALQYRLLGLWALDPARAAQLLDESNLVRFIAVDPALEIGPTIAPETVPLDQILRALFDCLDSAANIGFGGGTVIDALLTEAEMLVRLSGNLEQKARLDYYAGRAALDKDDFRESLKRHAAAEQTYATLSDRVFESSRKANLSRLFLCQRQLDLVEDAQASLNSLESFDAGDSPEYSARMQAYRGYLHLYHDLSLVPVYWNLAADIAKRAGNHQRFAHHAIGSAWALLLLDQEQKAANLFAEVESVLASGPKLHGLRMRWQLDAGVLAMVRQDWREAETCFSESLDQALQLDIFRRLWRIEANLANLYEILGNVDRCISYDRRAIQGILVRARAEESMKEKASWLHQRHALPILNVALRAHSGFVSSKKLLAQFTLPQQAEINRLKDLVLKDRLAEIPNDLGWHCKTLASHKRFIVTE